MKITHVPSLGFRERQEEEGAMKALIRAREWLWWLFGTVFGGSYLFLLYAVTFWLVVGALSAIQVRDALERDNLPFSFSDVDRAQSWLEIAQARIYSDLESKNIIAHQEDLRWQLIGQIENRFPDEFGDDNQFAYYSAQGFATSAGFGLAEHACSAVEEFSGKFAIEGCKLLDDYKLLNTQIQQLYETDVDDQISEQETAALVQFEKLRHLSDFVDVNQFFEALSYRYFLLAPREVLVMLLTIIMGVLGSVITMTWSFVRRDSSLSIRRFLLLPFVGGMSAFIILIFLKAGQLSMTGGETSDNLSPFFLSFVGIISGLLSERAYARMSEVGSNFFSVQEDKPRWGIRLEEAIQGADLSVHDMSVFLDLDEIAAEDIISGKSTATQIQQRLIAAAVRSDIRELFTDQPPRSITVETSPAQKPKQMAKAKDPQTEEVADPLVEDAPDPDPDPDPEPDPEKPAGPGAASG